MDATRHGAGLDRARLVEVSLLTVLSLFATVTTIFIFGTHINTWLSALSLTVAAR